MSSQVASAAAVSKQPRWERPLHIGVLCAFAFSEPLFAALTQQFVYLHDMQAGWFEIGAILLLLTVVIPLAWGLLDQLAILGAARFGGRGQDAVFTLLLVLVWLSLMRPFMRFNYLEVRAMVFLVSFPIAVAGAVLSSLLYARLSWVRRWLSIAAVGMICFPGMFVWQFASLGKAETHPTSVAITNAVPVVMIVFDEFSGTTLMNRELQIDSQRFPQFARLAGMSTWYRQASTVHTRTDVAVPALLSGQFPTAARPPLEGEYPGNLFRVIHGTHAYDMTVYEPVTRLCPPELMHREVTQRTRLEKLRLMMSTLISVYPRLILPNDTPLDFPPISKLWFGLSEKPDQKSTFATGLHRPTAFVERGEQLQSFLKSLQTASEKPKFCFLHAEVPHLPWCFLPSGHVYNFDEVNSFQPPGGEGEIGESWTNDAGLIARNEHRYLQQLGFADRFLGQLLDLLQEIDMLDHCLLIVTADHGVSYRPGHSRRVPDATNLADLLSIPLFIKMPDQTSGHASDENVESVDILPTIADVLGMELSQPVDGFSVSKSTRRPRKTLYYDHTMTAVEPAIPQLKAAVNRHRNLFEGIPFDQPPLLSVTHPEWRGRSTTEFVVEERHLSRLHMIPPARNSTELGPPFVPCLVAGNLDTRDFQDPIDLLVAVNGVIRDSGMTFVRERGFHGFEFLLPESAVAAVPSQIELFHVVQSAEKPARLQRLHQWTVNESN
jgi:hypothetical protein